MFTIALCDDNEMFLEKMRVRVESNDEFDETMRCECYPSGKELIESGVQRFDLVILDMQMDEIDGFHTAKEIRNHNDQAVLAFCSGIVTPQPEHFEVQPYRYLMKNDSTDKVNQVLQELLQEMKVSKKHEYVEVVSDGKAYRINVENILYISKYKRKSLMTIETNDVKESKFIAIPSSEKLDEWYEQLKEHGFSYAHSSYIVNLSRIDGVIRDDLQMPNGEILHISRAYKASFNEGFSHYFTKKYRRER